MKKIILGLAGACALSGFATTASAQMYGDTARVIAATPIFDRAAAPGRECRIEPTGTDRGSTAGYRQIANVPNERDVEPCESPGTAPRRGAERIVGYEVRYEYNGHEFRARMPYDPGPQMPVNVEVRPPLPRDSVAGPRTPNYRGPY